MTYMGKDKVMLSDEERKFLYLSITSKSIYGFRKKTIKDKVLGKITNTLRKYNWK